MQEIRPPEARDSAGSKAERTLTPKHTPIGNPDAAKKTDIPSLLGIWHSIARDLVFRHSGGGNGSGRVPFIVSRPLWVISPVPHCLERKCRGHGLPPKAIYRSRHAKDL